MPNLESESKLTPEQKQEAQMKDKLGKMFDDLQSGKMKAEEIKDKFKPLFLFKEILAVLPENYEEQVNSGIDQAVALKDKQEFIAKMILELDPMMQLGKNYPVLFEDAQAKIFMELGGFIPINERVSYGTYKDVVHFHLSPAFEVKERLNEIFLDAMKKLAEIVRQNPEIKVINGTSWIVATKTYGKALAGLGFEISEVTPEFKEEHFKGEEREIKKASMPRDKFLSMDWDKLIELEKAERLKNKVGN
ncbi:MAG: hypothetical protein NTX82_00155 [Candidatus Parcubacteria bacterium]|nr:hypothetical protein [Candidatus Parcubacteria bacterium]